MRLRTPILLLMVVLLLALGACAGRPSGLPVSPQPVKTLRPTFTPAVSKPAATFTPAPPPTATRPIASPTPPPTAVPLSPTPAPTPTAEKAAFVVDDNGVNVRSGPGTAFEKIGEVNLGQRFEITGKNSAGDWWQFSLNGRSAWVTASLVKANAAASSAPVAANIPAAPTARPVPTSPPAPPAPPIQPPAPAFSFSAAGAQPRPNSNNVVTVWCQVKTRDGASLVAGTIRVTLGGNAVKPDQSFTNTKNQGDTGYESQFDYNQNCKVEVQPATAGTYTAFLVDGNKQVSEPINFTVSGDTRTFILTWVQK